MLERINNRVNDFQDELKKIGALDYFTTNCIYEKSSAPRNATTQYILEDHYTAYLPQHFHIKTEYTISGAKEDTLIYVDHSFELIPHYLQVCNITPNEQFYKTACKLFQLQFPDYDIELKCNQKTKLHDTITLTTYLPLEQIKDIIPLTRNLDHQGFANTFIECLKNAQE